MLDKDLEILEPLVEQDESKEASYDDGGADPQPEIRNNTLHNLQKMQMVRNGIVQHIREMKQKLGLNNWQIKERVIEVNDILEGKTMRVLEGRHMFESTLEQMKDIAVILKFQEQLKKMKLEQLDQDIDSIDIELRNFRGLVDQAMEQRDLHREAYKSEHGRCFAVLLRVDKIKKQMMEEHVEHDSFSHRLRELINGLDHAYKQLEKKWKFLQLSIEQVAWQKERIERHKVHRMEFTDKLAKAREDYELITELYELAKKNWRMLELELEELQVADEESQVADEELPDENYETDY